MMHINDGDLELYFLNSPEISNEKIDFYSDTYF